MIHYSSRGTDLWLPLVGSSRIQLRDMLDFTKSNIGCWFPKYLGTYCIRSKQMGLVLTHICICPG